jgi:hypothetical protein
MSDPHPNFDILNDLIAEVKRLQAETEEQLCNRCGKLPAESNPDKETAAQAVLLAKAFAIIEVCSPLISRSGFEMTDNLN